MMEPTFIVEQMLFQTLGKLLTMKTNDFIQGHQCSINEKITDVQLQCEGYSLYKPHIALQNFFKVFRQIVRKVKQNKRIILKGIKINLNGFKMNEKEKGQNFKTLAQLIEQIGINIKTLWIHTSDIDNASLKDFESLIKLMNGVGQGDNSNFQDFSLQCANWNFPKRQPNFRQFKQVFDEVSKKLDGSTLHQRHIRLQISGWWYKMADAKIFLGFCPTKDELKQIDKDLQQYYIVSKKYEQQKEEFKKQLQQFHTWMQTIITEMLKVMSQIQQLQMDMRNMHEILQMKKMKQTIISIATTQHKQEKSLFSVRQTSAINGSNQNNDDKKFRFSVMM